AEKLIHARAVLAGIEEERSRLLDRLVVAAGLVTQATEKLELAWDLSAGPDVARVRIAGDQRERSLLPAAGDQDRRMRPAQALRQVERPTQLEVLAFESLIAAALALPHLQAGLDGFFEQVEAVPRSWREGQAEAGGLVSEITGAYSQHRAAPG